jgi:hypothetical protein
MTIKSLLALIVSAGMAALTIFSDGAHWLDGKNFSLLCVLALVHIVATAPILA